MPTDLNPDRRSSVHAIGAIYFSMTTGSNYFLTAPQGRKVNFPRALVTVWHVFFLLFSTKLNLQPIPKFISAKSQT